MKQFTLDHLRELEPCYDPVKYLPENWTGTALDILNVKAAPFPDRLWILMHTDFFSEKFLRLYGVWCARQAQHLMQDERSIKALDVSEAFANGNATEEQLAAASVAAWAAAVAKAADRNAAWGASDAASAASWASRPAGDSAWDAALYAMGAVVWEALKTSGAANDAARAAARAAADAVRAAALAAQENKLREMIKLEVSGGET